MTRRGTCGRRRRGGASRKRGGLAADECSSPQLAAVLRRINAEVALAGGDLIGPGGWADEASRLATGWQLARRW